MNIALIRTMDSQGRIVIPAEIRKQMKLSDGDALELENVGINMAKKEERFEVTFRDGSQLKDEGVRQILVDKETGVNYLCWKSGYGAAITPLLDSEGKVIVIK